MTTHQFSDDKKTKNEKQSYFLYQTIEKPNKNIFTQKYENYSTSIKSPFSENSNFISENYCVNSFNVYDNDFNYEEEENSKNKDELFSSFQNQIKSCEFIFIQKKRPYFDDIKSILNQNNNTINEKDKIISIDIMNDFDNMSIETTKDTRKRQKIIEIKKEIIKKRADFSVFEKPLRLYID